MSLRLPQLGADPASPFPPAGTALREPDGLLAMGGDLSPQRLLNAYAHGVFPWFSDGQPILWWSPDPRTVFRTDGVHLSARMRRELRRSEWRIVADRDFGAVIAACASAPRPGQDGTWITRDMQAAYCGLHRLGHAHSIEVWDGADLVGGIYGVAMGAAFAGESMFHTRTDASKIAFAHLVLRLRRSGFVLFDVQVPNPHLESLGCELLPREEYLQRLHGARSQMVELA